MRGELRPKEQAHAEMAVEWVRRLRPDAGDALLLAARRPRAPVGDPPGQRAAGPGRLPPWKRRLQQHHAEIAGRVLTALDYDEATVRAGPGHRGQGGPAPRSEVQTLEDALALVFVETQFTELADRLYDDHMVDVVVKTLRKMTPAGRDAALHLPLGEPDSAIVHQAVERL